MASRRERFLLDSEEEVEVTPPLIVDLARNDLRDLHEEEVYGDRDRREEVIFDIGDLNCRSNLPWPRFEYYEEEEYLNPS